LLPTNALEAENDLHKVSRNAHLMEVRMIDAGVRRSKPVKYSVVWDPKEPDAYVLTFSCDKGTQIERFSNWADVLVRACRLDDDNR